MIRHLLLAVRRPFNFKAYLVLVALLIPAAFAILPYAIHITSISNPEYAQRPPAAFLVDGLAGLAQAAVFGALGLLLASRIGLGLTLIEGWTRREPVWGRAPGVAGMAVLAGTAAALLLIAADFAYSPLMYQIIAGMEKPVTQAQLNPPAWQGLLASFSAGVNEETMFRLFGLSLLAWLGGLLVRTRSGRPPLWLLWAANITFAVLFGLSHLPATSQAGFPLNFVVVSRAILLNGIAGVTFGWLFWSFGLESAMIAHFWGDVIIHALFPLVTQQSSTTGSIIAWAVSLVVVIGAAALAVWAVRRDRRLYPPEPKPQPLPMEGHFPRPAA